MKYVFDFQLFMTPVRIKGSNHTWEKYYLKLF